jgi:L-ascorbate metabolism protein UlaG (beta-lactamase superfamily)
MTVHQRRLKMITLTIDGNEFQCQVQTWTLDPGTNDGDRQYTFCDDPANNSFIEETDNEPTLDLKFFSDWRSAGFSTYLWQHQGETVDFVLDHHPDITGEHVRWSGKVLVRPGPVGDDARTTEMTEVTLQIVGDPTFTEVA